MQDLYHQRYVCSLGSKLESCMRIGDDTLAQGRLETEGRSPNTLIP